MAANFKCKFLFNTQNSRPLVVSGFLLMMFGMEYSTLEGENFGLWEVRKSETVGSLRIYMEIP